MKYNLTEIFKNKTNCELYGIYLGQTSLSTEQRDYARVELENRNFNFKNMDKQSYKWDLENLIKAEKSFSIPLFRSIRSWAYLFIGYGWLVIAIIALF